MRKYGIDFVFFLGFFFHPYSVQQAPLKLGTLNVQASLNIFYGYFNSSISDLPALPWGDLRNVQMILHLTFSFIY